MEVAAIDPAAAKVVPGLPTQGVQVVAVVMGSPAAKAGLMPATRQVKVGGLPEPVGGDAIVALDGTPLTSSEQLLEAVTAAKPGDQLTLDVVRAGHPRTVAVTLANVPAKP